MSWFFRKPTNTSGEEPADKDVILHAPGYGISCYRPAVDANDILRKHGIVFLDQLKELLSSPWAKELAKKKAAMELAVAKDAYEAKLKELE